MTDITELEKPIPSKIQRDVIDLMIKLKHYVCDCGRVWNDTKYLQTKEIVIKYEI